MLKGVIVRFIVEERPVVTAVEVVGNRKFTDAQIRDALILRAGSSVDPFSIQTDIKTLIDMYKKQGYAQVSVTSDENSLKNGIVRYTITEGPLSKISAVKFDGNIHVKGSLLRWKIVSKPTFWIFRKGLLDEDKVQQDLVTIRDTYLKRGYIDVRVSYSLDYSEDKSKLTLRFAIVEGPLYKIGNIKVSGNRVFSSDELLGDLSRFGPGSYAERDKMDALQKRIEDRYGHEGYINRNVTLSPVYTDNPGIVDLNITVDEGQPFIVGRVIVRGTARSRIASFAGRFGFTRIRPSTWCW